MAGMYGASSRYSLPGYQHRSRQIAEAAARPTFRYGGQQLPAGGGIPVRPGDPRAPLDYDKTGSVMTSGQIDIRPPAMANAPFGADAVHYGAALDQYGIKPTGMTSQGVAYGRTRQGDLPRPSGPVGTSPPPPPPPSVAPVGPGTPLTPSRPPTPPPVAPVPPVGISRPPTPPTPPGTPPGPPISGPTRTAPPTKYITDPSTGRIYSDDTTPSRPDLDGVVESGADGRAFAGSAYGGRASGVPQQVPASGSGSPTGGLDEQPRPGYEGYNEGYTLPNGQPPGAAGGQPPAGQQQPKPQPAQQRPAQQKPFPNPGDREWFEQDQRNWFNGLSQQERNELGYNNVEDFVAAMIKKTEEDWANSELQPKDEGKPFGPETPPGHNPNDPLGIDLFGDGGGNTTEFGIPPLVDEDGNVVVGTGGRPPGGGGGGGGGDGNGGGGGGGVKPFDPKDPTTWPGNEVPGGPGGGGEGVDRPGGDDPSRPGGPGGGNGGGGGDNRLPINPFPPGFPGGGQPGGGTGGIIPTGGGGYGGQNNPLLQSLFGEYEKAYREGKDANVSRYQDLINFLNNRYTRGLSNLQGAGEQALADVDRDYSRMSADLDQDLISRGLRNSTVRASVQRGAQDDRQANRRRVQEDVRKERLATDATLSGDVLSAIERRSDTYPSLDQLIALATQMGQGGIAPNAGGGYGGGGRLPGGGQRGRMPQGADPQRFSNPFAGNRWAPTGTRWAPT